MIEVLTVDDHPSVMEGTKLLLEQEGDIRVRFANTAAAAIELLERLRFDVILVDLQMPDMNGLELSKRMLGVRPDATILIYTGFDFKNHFNVMVESGLSGFLPKTVNREQLVTAVRCAARGEVILPLELLRQLRRPNESRPEPRGDQVQACTVVSDRDRQILTEIARGKSNKEIAQTLLISQRSLEYALTDLFHKLKVKSRVEAVIKAGQLGIVDEGEHDADRGADLSFVVHPGLDAI
ncbi:response regulator transcription factor [Cohnella sp. GbtcB17]|uniref:response regulator n=1 Tax=Cohnella sp. GbtcB17 TaxID=2824762 RepID=UPI001C30142D|nr:response regulator transcription factor [Cohnella sp. GbtcB17]